MEKTSANLVVHEQDAVLQSPVPESQATSGDKSLLTHSAIDERDDTEPSTTTHPAVHGLDVPPTFVFDNEATSSEQMLCIHPDIDGCIVPQLPVLNNDKTGDDIPEDKREEVFRLNSRGRMRRVSNMIWSPKDEPYRNDPYHVLLLAMEVACRKAFNQVPYEEIAAAMVPPIGPDAVKSALRTLRLRREEAGNPNPIRKGPARVRTVILPRFESNSRRILQTKQARKAAAQRSTPLHKSTERQQVMNAPYGNPDTPAAHTTGMNLAAAPEASAFPEGFFQPPPQFLPMEMPGSYLPPIDVPPGNGFAPLPSFSQDSLSGAALSDLFPDESFELYMDPFADYAGFPLEYVPDLVDP